MVGEHGDAIKITLRAPAVEGKANTALRSFLAEKLSIPQRAIVMEHGERSREKVIRIDGLTEEEIRRGLAWKSRAVIRKATLRAYSVMILSAHSTSETKIFGLPNFAPYSFKSASVTPLALEHAPHA